MLRSLSSFALAFFIAGGAPPAKTWCQYRVKRGAPQRGYCSQLELHDAEKECDARIQHEGLGGACFCTDDGPTLAARCKRR
jgi:hypothetical protein